MTTRSTTGKKQLQNFHVRTALWNLFERRAREMDCSTDYLINEAMRLYASTHGFLDSQEEEPEAVLSAVPRRQIDEAPPPPVPRPTAPGRPIPQGMQTIPRPVRPSAAAVPQPGAPLRPSRPPPPPRPRKVATGSMTPRPTLTMIFQGRKVAISADQFIIGRGAKSSDFMIKDANISRKHAAIIYHNNTYYIKDLGSTNGIEFNGKTVDSKRIDEGDVFTICGYELHFTYSA